MRPHRQIRKYVGAPLVVAIIYISIAVSLLLLTNPLLPKLVGDPHVLAVIPYIRMAITAMVLYYVVRRSRVAVKESMQDYKDLVDLGRKPILLYMDGKVVDVNAYALRLFDTNDKDLIIGKPVLDFIHVDDRDRARGRILQLQSGAPTDVTEMKMISVTGAEKEIETIGIPKKIQGGIAVQVLARDITQRKQIERNLQEVVRLFRLIEDNMSELITILGKNGRVYYASPSHTQILGRTFHSEDDSMSLSKYVHPDEQAHVIESCREMMRKKQPLRIQYRLQHSSSYWLHVEMHGTPILDRDGEVEGAVMVTRDITERVLTEDLLRRSDKLAAVGQLAAGLAHEVRNPMTVLQGFIQLLRSTEKPNEDYISLMLSEVQRIESIITDFLVFAKPALTKVGCVDICNLLQYTVALLETQAIMKSIEIHTECNVECAEIECNEDNIKQVFINVIKNAIEAMPDGGLITIRVEQRGDQIHILVIDQGEGIPEHLIPRLGEPFFTTKENGTGLGLLVTHKLVENNHGQIRFTSKPGNWTQVDISFPLCPKTVNPAQFEEKTIYS